MHGSRTFFNSKIILDTLGKHYLCLSPSSPKHTHMRIIYTFFLSLLTMGISAQSDLVLTAVFDGPLAGGTPKGFEFYATAEIADLSTYAIGVANNGGGTDGIEYTFPADIVTAGSYVYVASETDGFNAFFGFMPNYVDGIANINGDDAVELYKDGAVVDVFGDIELDGTDEPWEHLDGWAYRLPSTGPDGSTFQLGSWTFSGINAFDGTTVNASAPTPMPIGTYGSGVVADHTINIVGLTFVPDDITIEQGDIVLWTNTTGVGHNVNGTQATYPNNPEGFTSGAVNSADWEYAHTFNVAGIYDYVCDPHASANMVGKITVNEPVGDPDPDAVADFINMMQNGNSTYNVWNNDYIPFAVTSFDIVDSPSNGQAMITGDSIIVYNPDQDYCGEDMLTYAICLNNGLCDTTAVNYTVMCPTVYPSYPISVVTTLDGEGSPDSLGVPCAVTGIVYGVNLRPSGLQFTLIDETDADAGMGVFFGTGDLGYTVTEGDKITIEGTMAFFNGLTQINPESVNFISSGNALHTAAEVSILSEATESKLIKLSGVSLADPAQWDPQGSGFNVVVTDGTNNFDVRIDADTDLFAIAAPTGQFNLTGIGGQFDNSSPYSEGYQLLPRYEDDISIGGAAQNIEDPSLQLYPNPTKHQLTVTSEMDWEAFEIYDMNGKLMMSNPFFEKGIIDIEALSAGNYFIKLINKAGVVTRSLQKI